MTLVLTITNVDRLENGLPTRLRLDRHGAVIGRSPTADWSLPDPQHYISSVHCEIDYRDGGYVLVDKSTNGTFVNGDQHRLAAPHAVCGGDVIVIGHYSIKADLDDGAGVAAGAAPEPQQAPAWGGWKPQQAAAGVDDASWDRQPAAAAITGHGAMSQNWAPPQVDAAPVESAWSTPAPAPTPASGWSSPVNDAPSAPSATDVWGQLAASNVVDWARGGFGEAKRDAAEPLGLGGGGAKLRPGPAGARRSRRGADAERARDPISARAPRLGIAERSAPRQLRRLRLGCAAGRCAGPGSAAPIARRRPGAPAPNWGARQPAAAAARRLSPSIQAGRRRTRGVPDRRRTAAERSQGQRRPGHDGGGLGAAQDHLWPRGDDGGPRPRQGATWGPGRRPRIRRQQSR